MSHHNNYRGQNAGDMYDLLHRRTEGSRDIDDESWVQSSVDPDEDLHVTHDAYRNTRRARTIGLPSFSSNSSQAISSQAHLSNGHSSHGNSSQVQSSHARSLHTQLSMDQKLQAHNVKANPDQAWPTSHNDSFGERKLMYKNSSQDPFHVPGEERKQSRSNSIQDTDIENNEANQVSFQMRQASKDFSIPEASIPPSLVFDEVRQLPLRNEIHDSHKLEVNSGINSDPSTSGGSVMRRDRLYNIDPPVPDHHPISISEKFKDNFTGIGEEYKDEVSELNSVTNGVVGNARTTMRRSSKTEDPGEDMASLKRNFLDSSESPMNSMSSTIQSTSATSSAYKGLPPDEILQFISNRNASDVSEETDSINSTTYRNITYLSSVPGRLLPPDPEVESDLSNSETCASSLDYRSRNTWTNPGARHHFYPTQGKGQYNPSHLGVVDESNSLNESDKLDGFSSTDDKNEHETVIANSSHLDTHLHLHTNHTSKENYSAPNAGHQTTRQAPSIQGADDLSFGMWNNSVRSSKSNRSIHSKHNGTRGSDLNISTSTHSRSRSISDPLAGGSRSIRSKEERVTIIKTINDEDSSRKSSRSQFSRGGSYLKDYGDYIGSYYEKTGYGRPCIIISFTILITLVIAISVIAINRSGGDTKPNNSIYVWENEELPILQPTMSLEPYSDIPYQGGYKSTGTYTRSPVSQIPTVSPTTTKPSTSKPTKVPTVMPSLAPVRSPTSRAPTTGKPIRAGETSKPTFDSPQPCITPPSNCDFFCMPMDTVAWEQKCLWVGKCDACCECTQSN